MPTKKKPPRKPSQPLGHIVFGAKGGPAKVLEALPGTQEDLEAAIVKKFIGALKHFENRGLSLPTRGNPWPDFETQEGQRVVGIEVVEVLNEDHARKRALQEQYARHIRTLTDSFRPKLAGLSITLDDRYQEPPYPPLNTEDGKRLAQSIADNLRSLVPQLEQLELGRVFGVRWQKEPGLPQTGVLVHRSAPLDAGISAAIGFSSSFPQTVANAQSLLSRTVEGKLSKSYQNYQSGRLWLLAYGHDPCMLEPAAIALAKLPLQTQKHPFDEVWSIFPYAAMDLGAIAKVWP